ncbi:MAG TPA: tripartite tricarboxylate transporter substrate binding protein [Burkholderiales bacterium]|nr:tripartite tricarboxylate transporter substrate binding protein [Burkholderiales bacterium]
MTRALTTCACAALALGFGAAAHAQNYPAKPVRIIVPFAAGGPADIFARFEAQRLQDALGGSFVVDNRPGAGSIIGTEIAQKSPPDGYTLLMMSNTHTVNESLVPKKPFTLMKDFVAIAPVNYSDLLMVVHPTVPAKSVKEFVALAKAKPRGMNYASSGTGTPYHMAGELFKALAHVDIVHVPHKGSAEARTSVVSGQVEMMIDAITTMAPIAKSGRVRALATTGKKRSDVMPDVPTVEEAGVKGYEAVIWLGLMAPAGTPKAAIDRLNAEMAKIAARPDVRKTWLEQGAVPMSMTTAEFERFLNDDIAKWAKIVKISGARVDQ